MATSQLVTLVTLQTCGPDMHTGIRLGLALGQRGLGLGQDWNCRGGGWGLNPPPQFISIDAHFLVKIGLKFQSLCKISNISTSGPTVLLGQFQHWSHSQPRRTWDHFTAARVPVRRGCDESRRTHSVEIKWGKMRSGAVLGKNIWWPLIIWEATTAKRNYNRTNYIKHMEKLGLNYVEKIWGAWARFGGLCPHAPT